MAWNQFSNIFFKFITNVWEPGSDNDVDSGLKQSTPPDMDIPEADLGLVLQNHDNIQYN